TPPGRLTLSSRRMRRQTFYDLSFDELVEWLAERDLPRFRAIQLYEWVYRHHVRDFRRVVVLPADLRERMHDELPLDALTPVRDIHTDDGETEKTLYRTFDGQTIETVLMY